MSLKEDIRFIECQCGEWEQFPADMSRQKSHTFDHISNLDTGEAQYKCACGNTVASTSRLVGKEDK
jgi:hypothetical protein